MKIPALICLVAAFVTGSGCNLEAVPLSERFYSEGAAVADLDGDGHPDVISGPFWYAGPTFERRHRYMPGEAFSIKGYSAHFFTFAEDFNADGHPDLLVIPIPGNPAHWFENPGDGMAEQDTWRKHPVLSSVDGESPGMYDLTGDGVRELVCIHDGDFGYASPNPTAPDEPWHFTPISSGQKLGRFTHGMGVGDVNGDGRPDLLERRGWWEQPAEPDRLFTFHRYPFAASGGSQMFAYDFDGDGDNDVLTVQNAHGYGLTWFEQRGGEGDVGFLRHDILPDRETEGGLNLSQMHAVALADMDGDGVQDIITGKRYFAHGGRDPGAHRLPALYWFRTVRTAGTVRFEPRLLHPRVGVGTQLVVHDIDGNGRPEVIVGNKLGTFIVQNRVDGQTEPPTLTVAQQRIGSDEFANAVRETEHLSPREERETFVLPAGFNIDLVAAEPAIDKPMNMAFDARGRLWVSSSREYPFAAPEDRTGRDSIRILEDTTGDGQFDRTTVFADGLNIPMGLLPYRDGVVCFSIPNIWFLRDTDGDGVCDKREVLYGPFGYDKDTHGLCNAFTRGRDGWVYACHGFNNTSTVAGRDGHAITLQSGNTFRFRLDGSRIEHYTHGLVNPFGLATDRHGDLFVADCHTKPVSLLLQNGYYDSFGKPHDGLGYVPNVMEHLHGSTAIGGIAISGNEDWPEAYRGSTFGGNVMTSRINRNSLQHRGSSPEAREEPDFLTSGDPWFRPVDLQFGPDGALYVADFYNRIIGHYEVDLNHPGRDRVSGRIWKITYNRPPDPQHDHDLTKFDLDRLLDEFPASNLTRQGLLIDRVVDHFGQRAVPTLRTRFDTDAELRSPLLWMLGRLDALDDDLLTRAVSDRNPHTRRTAMRVLGEMLIDSPATPEWLLRGLRDQSDGADAAGPNPFVQRAATMAMTRNRARRFITPLIETFHATPAHDVHLRHALRMALRDHLQSERWFRDTAASATPRDVPLIAEICLALESPTAGEFLVRHIDIIAETQPERLQEALRVAARSVTGEAFAPLVLTARKQFANDWQTQIELLGAIRGGLQQRGASIPPPVRVWAEELARDLIGDPHARPSLGWTYQPHTNSPNDENSWVVTSRRNSTDGERNSVLFSSIPKGEQRTGVYRSEAFSLGDRFHFWMAGHDGFPGRPVGNNNGVRLRDAITGEILQTFPPPRNDVAHRYEWERTSERTTTAFLELFDGDAGTAYAWIAVGRFADSRLNPTLDANRRAAGVGLVGEFSLRELSPTLITILKAPRSRDVERSVMEALLKTTESSSADLLAIASLPNIAGVTQPLRAEAKRVLIARSRGERTDSEVVRALLQKAFRVGTLAEQRTLAERLSGDRAGVETLLHLIEAGHASATLLQDSTMTSRIASLEDDAIDAEVSKLTEGLPSVNEKLSRVIEAYQAEFLIGSNDDSASRIATGEALFTKNCAVCHQIAGRGKQVGPNLDGVATRGAKRLIEDILDPNRNVDVNFRATTVVTTSGRIHTGFLKPSRGDQLVLVDRTGKEITIAKGDVEEQLTGRQSPMPSNFHETLKREKFRALLEYLMSRR